MTPDERAYYVSHSLVSDPGELAAALAALPADPQQLVEAVAHPRPRQRPARRRASARAPVHRDLS